MITTQDKEAADKFAEDRELLHLSNESWSLYSTGKFRGYKAACEEKNKQMVAFAEWIQNFRIAQDTDSKEWFFLRNEEVYANTTEELLTKFLNPNK